VERRRRDREKEHLDQETMKLVRVKQRIKWFLISGVSKRD
jgi:hypothetical protein